MRRAVISLAVGRPSGAESGSNLTELIDTDTDSDSDTDSDFYFDSDSDFDAD